MIAHLVLAGWQLCGGNTSEGYTCDWRRLCRNGYIYQSVFKARHWCPVVGLEYGFTKHDALDWQDIDTEPLTLLFERVVSNEN